MSSSSRDRILAAIRRSQNNQPKAERSIEERLKSRPRGPLPSVEGDLETVLIDRLLAAACTVALR